MSTGADGPGAFISFGGRAAGVSLGVYLTGAAAGFWFESVLVGAFVSLAVCAAITAFAAPHAGYRRSLALLAPVPPLLIAALLLILWRQSTRGLPGVSMRGSGQLVRR